MTALTCLKLKAGKYYQPVELEDLGKSYKVSFKYNRTLINEIKNLEGAKWDPDTKTWTIKKSQRNKFSLHYLSKDHPNPYDPYRRPPDIKIETSRPLYNHQLKLLKQALTTRSAVWAAEMGTGKTLAAIELMERAYAEGIDEDEMWYVCPKSVMLVIKHELIKWQCKVTPKLMTYESLKKTVENWEPGVPAPRVLICDESSKVKTWNSQRTQATKYIADCMREEHPDDHYIVLMSGSPAPKSPVDWWSQCEIARPGFIKEPNPNKFSRSLALIKFEDTYGVSYPKLVTWFDDPEKCKECGERPAFHDSSDHTYQPSINEIERLNKRLQGLVTTVFKRDCLDLPDKIYETIYLEPSKATLRAMHHVVNTSPTAIEALTLCRELSDGFQYSYDSEGKRTTKQVPTPKQDALIDILDAHDSRIVIYAGFTGSVDRVSEICQKQGWEVFRIDGRGFSATDGTSKDDFLDRFQSPTNYPQKIAIVAQPGAGGYGFTFTAASTVVYWSNTFKGEDRIQSEDRVHRAGMDVRVPPTIIDLIHLDTDKVVYDNIKKKRDLQNMSLGNLQAALKES